MYSQVTFNLTQFISRQTYHGWVIPKFRKERTILDHELVFVTSGKGDIYLDGIKHTVSENAIIYFAPHQVHRLEVLNDTPMHFYAMHFSFLDNQSNLDLPQISTIEASAKILNLIKELEQIHTRKEYLYKWRENILLNEILLETYRSIHANVSPSNVIKINKVLEFIHNQPYDNFSIDLLCTHVGMKKSLFIKCFKEITGSSPVKYCNTLKLEYAKDLLINHANMSISAIAMSCGFEDPLYFSRVFKNYTGLSPKDFQNTL